MFTGLGVGLVVVGLLATSVAKGRRTRARQQEAEPTGAAPGAAAPAQQQSGGAGSKDVLQGLLSGSQAGVVGAGLALSAAAGEAVKKLGGSEAEQNLARLNALQLGAPIAANLVLNKGLEAVGVKDATVRNDLSQAATVAAFAAPLLPLFATVKVGEKLVGLFKGEEPPGRPLGELFTPGEVSRLASQPLKLADIWVDRRKDLAAAHVSPYTHVVRARVSCGAWDNEAPAFRLMVDRKVVTPDLYAVAPRHRNLWQEHFLRVVLTGAQTVGIVFVNGGYSPSEGYRVLWVDWLKIDGAVYRPADGTYYRVGDTPRHHEGLWEAPTLAPEERGSPAMNWTGVLEWKLRPEHQPPAGTPVRVPFASGTTRAEQLEWEASTKFVP